MGNRAVITTKAGWQDKERNLGIYLHWNGGRDSVEAFLKYCELKGFRSPDKDCYGWARLCQVAANFFGGGLSIGIDTVSKLDYDNWDNGVYIIEDWQIVGRECFEDEDCEQDTYPLTEMLMAIDECQPRKEQLGPDFLQAEEIPVSELKVGQFIYFQETDGSYSRLQVVGIGEDKFVNGSNVKGIPFVNNYGREENGITDYSWNTNNYIKTETIRVCK